jgi:RHS repeat-associated protein
VLYGSDHRFYASTYGRFNTPDRITPSNAKVIPANWNKYAYVSGDPINKRDPRGTCSPDDDPPCYSATGTASSGDSWSWGDPLGDDFWASMDFDPAAAAECLPGCMQAQVGPGPGVPPALPPAAQEMFQIVAAEQGAWVRLFSPNCAGLFLAPDNNTPLADAGVAATLTNAMNSGNIKLMSVALQNASLDNPNVANPNVPAFTTDGASWILEGRSFSPVRRLTVKRSVVLLRGWVSLQFSS